MSTDINVTPKNPPEGTMGAKTKPVGKFADLATLDAKIPPNLMMTYQGKPYVLKAGLEWKAAQVFGIGGYSLETEIIERDDNRIVVKATLMLMIQPWAKYTNYGECNKMNTPPIMQKYALHLAVTRAECRVLRMATACGYVAFEEMENGNDTKKEIPESADDGKPVTPALQQAIEKLAKTNNVKTEYKFDTMTCREAREIIDQLRNI